MQGKGSLSTAALNQKVNRQPQIQSINGGTSAQLSLKHSSFQQSRSRKNAPSFEAAFEDVYRNITRKAGPHTALEPVCKENDYVVHSGRISFSSRGGDLRYGEVGCWTDPHIARYKMQDLTPGIGARVSLEQSRNECETKSKVIELNLRSTAFHRHRAGLRLAWQLSAASQMLIEQGNEIEGLKLLANLTSIRHCLVSAYQQLEDRFTLDASCTIPRKHYETGLKTKLVHWLGQYDIDPSYWGTGSSRTFNNFVSDVGSGELQLVARNGKVYADADVILFRVLHPDVNGKLWKLIELEQIFADGRRRIRTTMGGLPGEKKLPDETDYATSVRALREELAVACYDSIKAVRYCRKVENSQNYPGVIQKSRYTFVDVRLPMQEIERLKYGHEEITDEKTTIFTWVPIRYNVKTDGSPDPADFRFAPLGSKRHLPFEQPFLLRLFSDPRLYRLES